MRQPTNHVTIAIDIICMSMFYKLLKKILADSCETSRIWLPYVIIGFSCSNKTRFTLTDLFYSQDIHHTATGIEAV